MEQPRSRAPNSRRPNPKRGIERKLVEAILGYYLKKGDVVRFEHTVESLDDVWDLTMLGNERLDVEHRYQKLTGGRR
jgi:hypothetical protein